AERLGLPPEPLDFIDSDVERRRPRLVGAARAFAEPCFPFFIAWDDAARVRRALSETSASVHHERGARGIAWVEVAGDRDAIGEWIGDLGPRVRVAPGEPALRAIGIATDDGEAVLETAA